MIKNQKGSSTLLMIMLVMALSLFCLFTIEYGKRQLYSNLSRARAYSCMKTQLHTIHNYAEVMKPMNLAIKSAFALSVIPAVKTLHQTLVQIQKIYHASFVQKLAMKGACHFSQRISFFYNLPYQTRGVILIAQGIDGAALPSKDKKWTYQLSNYAGRKNELPSFVLSAEVSFKSERFKLVSTSEETIVAWSLSQFSSYSPSLVRWLQRPLEFILN